MPPQPKPSVPPQPRPASAIAVDPRSDEQLGDLDDASGLAGRRAAWRSDHVTGLIVFVTGCVTMIAAGVFLILLGPQG